MRGRRAAPARAPLLGGMRSLAHRAIPARQHRQLGSPPPPPPPPPLPCPFGPPLRLHRSDSSRLRVLARPVISFSSASAPSPQLIDSYYLASELKQYCAAHPGRIPPDDAGRPALPILTDYFCSRMWQQLISPDTDHASNGMIFERDIERFVADADLNGDHAIDAAEFDRLLVTRMGDGFGGRVLAAQCIACADADKDGKVSCAELATYLRRQGLATSDGCRRSMSRRSASRDHVE